MSRWRPDVTRVLTWTASSGQEVRIRVDLVPALTDAGNPDPVRREIEIEAEVDGRTVGYGIERLPRPIDHPGGRMVARVGDVGLTAERLARLEALVREVEATRTGEDREAWRAYYRGLVEDEREEARRRRIEHAAEWGWA